MPHKSNPSARAVSAIHAVSAADFFTETNLSNCHFLFSDFYFPKIKKPLDFSRGLVKVHVYPRGDTFSACKPFGPCFTSNSTCCPSFKVLYPSDWMAEK